MRLTRQVADEIMRRAHSVLNRSVRVVDDRGVVLVGETAGSTVVDALRACQEGRVIRSESHQEQIAWCPFVYEGQTVGAFGVIEEGPQITPEAVGLLQGLAEVIVHQEFLLEHIRPTEIMQAQFLQQVLSSNELEADEAHRQADILQINLRAPQAIMMIQIENFDEDCIGERELSVEEREHRIAISATKISVRISDAVKGNGSNIVSYLGNSQFLISKGIGGEGLNTRNTLRFLSEKAAQTHQVLTKALAKRIVSLGVGQYYPDLGGLRKSFQEAKLSLLVGTKVWGLGKVYHIKQVGMFITLANVAQERKAELAHQILHPLLRDEQLFKTVQTFLGMGLNLTDAAEKLHIHRNTLIYRLDKTKKVIGLDPRNFDDALQIKLGLMFYQEN